MNREELILTLVKWSDFNDQKGKNKQNLVLTCSLKNKNNYIDNIHSRFKNKLVLWLASSFSSFYQVGSHSRARAQARAHHPFFSCYWT
ncbi:hypothetical protein Hanom_Chr17g01533141 [Helianthus anomalus]